MENMSSVKIVQESNFILMLSKNVFSSLWMVLVCTFLAWYVQYHWKRRKMYSFASKMNGPFPLPIVGNALDLLGPNHEILDKLLGMTKHYKSPAKLWLGQNLLINLWKPQHLEIALNQALQKSDLYRHTEVVCGTGLFTAKVPKWRRHKKIIMPTFNQKILDNFVEVFSEQSELLVEQLKKTSGKGIIDIYDYISRCTLSIICETAMGVKIHAQTTDCDYMKWLSRGLEMTFQKIICIWYQFDFLFNRSAIAKEYYVVINNILNFSRNVVKERRAAYRAKLLRNKEKPEALVDEEPKKRMTFLDQLIELSEGEKFTDEELREEVDTFMVAGSDTTASIDCFVLVMLGMHPEIQERVYQEVMDILGPDRPVDYTDLGHFVYLDRVIKETMRVFPVGPMLMRSATEDIQVENYTMPAGSSIILNIIALHRDPETWPNPLDFNPDRFLPEEVSKRHPYSWLPFLGGPRYCVGRVFAVMAMKTLIATVIRKYRVFTEYKSIGEIGLQADVTIKPIHGHKVFLELRNNAM